MRLFGVLFYIIDGNFAYSVDFWSCFFDRFQFAPNRPLLPGKFVPRACDGILTSLTLAYVDDNVKFSFE